MKTLEFRCSFCNELWLIRHDGCMLGEIAETIMRAGHSLHMSDHAITYDYIKEGV